MSGLGARGQATLFKAISAGQCPTYNALRAMATALIEAESQVEIFGAQDNAPTQAEREAAVRLERKIDQVVKMLAAGFDDGECSAARKVDPNKASAYAEKLALIRKHLDQMERALRAAAVQQELLAA